MKRLTFLLLSLVPACLPAQTSTSTCSEYNRLIQEGDTALSEGRFETAIKRYNAAALNCSSKISQAQERILAAFKKIEQLKKDAEDARQRARQAEEVAKAALEKMEEAKRQADIDKRKAEDAAGRLSETFKEVEAQRDTARRQKLRADEALQKMQTEQAKNERIVNALYFYHERYAVAVNAEKRFGYINKEGETVIEYKYEQAGPFQPSGLAEVRRFGADYFIDTAGTEYRRISRASDLDGESRFYEDQAPFAYLFHKKKIYRNEELVGLTLDEQSPRITRIPRAIGGLTNLKYLSLRFNRVKKVSPAITRLQHLETLDLSFNELTYLPPGIEQMKTLRVLNLAGNPMEFNYLKELTQKMPWCFIEWESASSLYYRKEYALAEKKAVEELRQAQQGNNPFLIFNAAGNLSWYALFAGKYSEALASAETAIKFAAKTDEKNWPKTNLGHAYLLKGEWDNAAKTYRSIKHLPDDSGNGFANFGLAIWQDLQDLAAAGIHHPDMVRAAELALDRPLTEEERKKVEE